MVNSTKKELTQNDLLQLSVDYMNNYILPEFYSTGKFIETKYPVFQVQFPLKESNLISSKPQFEILKSKKGGKFVRWNCEGYIKPDDNNWTKVPEKYQEGLNGLVAVRVIRNESGLGSTVPMWLGGRSWKIEIKVKNVPKVCCGNCREDWENVCWRFTDSEPDRYSLTTSYGKPGETEIHTVCYGGSGYSAAEAALTRISCWYCDN